MGSFHISLDKTPGGFKRQPAAGELCAVGGACGMASPRAAAGREAARMDRVTSLEDSTLHVTLVTHRHLGAKCQPGCAG